MIIELIGAPGAGKTTLLDDICVVVAEHDRTPLTVEQAARPIAARTALGRLVVSVAPRSMRQRALWGVFRILSGLYTVRYIVANRQLTRIVLRSQRGRPPESDAGHRRVLYWFLRTVGSFAFLRTHLRPAEVLILDEGFAHRVVQLFTSSIESAAQSDLAAYAAALPRPDLMIHIRADLGTCQRRVRSRGVWQRVSHRADEEIDRFVANAHDAVISIRDILHDQGWCVLDHDNHDDLQDSRSELRQTLAATLAGQFEDESR